MGNEMSLTPADIRGGAAAVQARLRTGVNPNRRMLFAEDVGPLPRGCKCTPVGYALLAGDMAMLDVLINAGADLRKPVGLPHRFDFMPLHLAAALGQESAVRKLLTHGADANAVLQLKRGATGPPPPPPAAADSSSPATTTPSPPVALLPVNMHYTRAGDLPLHIAIDCFALVSSDGFGSVLARIGGGSGTEVVEALISHEATDPNAPNARNRTPLYKACKRRLAECVALLATHPRVNVNTGGPLFAAITVESSELVRMLLQAGASASGRNDQGQSPLRYTLARASLFFHNRAEIVSLLIDAGARVEQDMVISAEQRNWRRVQAALQVGIVRQAAAAAAAAAAPLNLQQLLQQQAAGDGGLRGQQGDVPPSPDSGPRWLRAPVLAPRREHVPEAPSASAALPNWTLERIAARRAAERQGPAVGGRSGAAGSPQAAAAAAASPEAAAAAVPQAEAASSSPARDSGSNDSRTTISGGRGDSSGAVSFLRNLSRNPLGAIFMPLVAPFAILVGVAEVFGQIAQALDAAVRAFLIAAAVCAPAGLYGLYCLVKLVLRLAWNVYGVPAPLEASDSGIPRPGLDSSSCSASGSRPPRSSSGGLAPLPFPPVQPTCGEGPGGEAGVGRSTGLGELLGAAVKAGGERGGALGGAGAAGVASPEDPCTSCRSALGHPDNQRPLSAAPGSCLAGEDDSAAGLARGDGPGVFRCSGPSDPQQGWGTLQSSPDSPHPYGPDPKQCIKQPSDPHPTVLEALHGRQDLDPSPPSCASPAPAQSTAAAATATYNPGSGGGPAAHSATASASASAPKAISFLYTLWQAYLSFFVAVLACVLALAVVFFAMGLAEATLLAVMPSRTRVWSFLQDRERWRQARGEARTGAEPAYIPYYIVTALGLRWSMGVPFWTLTALLMSCFAIHELYDACCEYLTWKTEQGQGQGQRHVSNRSREAAGGGRRRRGGGTGRGAQEGQGDHGVQRPVEGQDNSATEHTEEEEPVAGPADRGGGPGGDRGGAPAAVEARRGGAVTEVEEGAAGGLDGLCCVCMSSRAVMGFVHRDVVHCCLCCACETEMRRRGQLRNCLICKRASATLVRVVVT